MYAIHHGQPPAYMNELVSTVAAVSTLWSTLHEHHELHLATTTNEIQRTILFGHWTSRMERFPHELRSAATFDSFK